MKFTKMQGIGNDFIFIEDLDNKLLEKEVSIAKKLCDRHFAIGADGLVVVRKLNNLNMKMTIINSDGSRANMCGNAIRCFGRYIYDKGYVKDKKFIVETDDGKKEIELISEDNIIIGARVYMGKPSFKGELIPLNNKKELIKEEVNINNKIYELTTLLMGVPHTIVIDKNNNYNVLEGKYIEKFSYFKEGTNVNFVKVIDSDTIKVDTWERGAGRTLACGTGTCASAVVTNKFGLTNNKVLAKLPGGELIIEVLDNGVYMTGNAEYICKGETL